MSTWEMWGDIGRYRELQGDVGEMWLERGAEEHLGDVGRYREI